MSNTNINKTNYSIQFLRYLFIITICYGHSLLITLLAQYDEYFHLAHYIRGVFIGPIFFFIMGGFFLRRALKKNVEKYIQERIIRLWPTLAFSILVFFILVKCKWYFTGMDYSDVATLLMLQGTGICQACNANGPAWFICVLFWTSIFYFILLKIIKNQKLQVVVVAFITIVSGILYEINMPNMSIRDLLFNFIPMTMLCGITFLGYGILLSFFNDYISKYIKKYDNNKIAQIIYSLLEIIPFAFICRFYFYTADIIEKYKYHQLFFILMFSIMFIMFINNAGLLSKKIFNNKIWDLFGKVSFSIYIMQSVMFVVIYHYCLLYLDFFKTHVFLILFIIMVLYNLIGFIAYFLVEKPAISLYKKIEGKNNE